MNKPDQKMLHAILREIDSRLSQGLLPVHNGHLEDLSQKEELLEWLLSMKKEGLISGDLITRGADSTPYRITNIRLTYLGIRVLRS
jgi:hypothetical protein